MSCLGEEAGFLTQNHKTSSLDWERRDAHAEVCRAEKEWAGHWPCNSEVQCAVDTPWRTEELRSLAEGLPHLNEENLERGARS